MQRRFWLSVLCSALLSGLLFSQESTSSSSSKSKQKSEQHLKASVPAPTDEGLYRNAEFGFTYHVRYGWVDRTEAMQPTDNDAAQSRLLLAAFEHPPEVTGEGVNSAVIITVENAASYPGLKTALDYMGPLTELTTAKGFKTVEGPYEFPVGGQMLVRGDFTKDLGKVTMYQSSLVMLHKGSVALFTFIGGSENEVDELVEKLNFAPSSKRH